MALRDVETRSGDTSNEILSGNHLFEIFTIPEEDPYLDAIISMSEMGVNTVVGNSANTARSKFGEDLAKRVGARFVHTGLKPKVDELTRAGAEEIHPNGVNTLKQVASYLEASALSKYHRFTRMSNEELSMLGINKKKIDKTLLIFGDAEDFADGFVHGKPHNREEAISQIARAVTGDPYFIVNAQVAIWGDLTKGTASNIHITPVRVDPTLDRIQRWNLREKWIGLYDNPKVYVTPRGASASNPEILPFMEVGVAHELGEHSMHVGDTALLGEHKFTWKNVLSLPEPLKNEFCTNLMGAAPRGFAEVIVRLVNPNTSDVGGKIDLINRLSDLV